MYSIQLKTYLLKSIYHLENKNILEEGYAEFIRGHVQPKTIEKLQTDTEVRDTLSELFRQSINSEQCLDNPSEDTNVQAMNLTLNTAITAAKAFFNQDSTTKPSV